MADISKAFRIKVLSLDDSVGIFEGAVDPTVIDQGNITAVPLGSLYIRHTGQLYQKTGTGNLNWTLSSTGVGAQLPDTDISNVMNLLNGSNMTVDRSLTFTTGDADRTITINGNTVLDNWFDQGLKTTDAPTHSGMTLTLGNALNLNTQDGVLTSPSIQGVSTSGANAAMTFRVAGSEVMRMNEAGNVGIGNTNPVSILDVKGFIQDATGDTLLLNTTSDATLNQNKTIYAARINHSNFSLGSGVTDSGIRGGMFLNAASGVGNFIGSLGFNYGAFVRAGIQNSNTSASIGTVYGLYSQILNNIAGTNITNAYGIFIENTNTAGTITNRYDLFASSGNAKNYFAGNLGIGNSNPTTKLVVTISQAIPPLGSDVSAVFSNAPSNSIAVVSGTTGQAAIQFGTITIANKGSVTYGNATNSMSFYTNTSEQMRIDSGGNMGIGTTSPLAKLDTAQTSTTAAIPVLKLDQSDVDDVFINFVGTENATIGSIKTGLTAHGGTQKFIKCEINGVVGYIQWSTTPV